MRNKSEIAVSNFFKKMDFPGIRHGEDNAEICNYLKNNNYNYTPDLVAGPEKIEDAKLEDLFFIDVVQPKTDIIFKQAASYQLNKNISKKIIELLNKNTKKQRDTVTDSFPNEHHQLYLSVINKKLKKYSHDRKYIENGQSMISANYGIVHHFDLGSIQDNTISNTKELITLIDYIRFYKHLAPHGSIDITNASTLLWEEIVKKQPDTPYILVTDRDWNDLPCWFQMIHVNISRDNITHDFAIILVNSYIFKNSNHNYPVYKWFMSNFMHHSSQVFNGEELFSKKTVFHVKGSNGLFSH